MAAERGRTRPERRGELGGRGPHLSTAGKTGRGTRSLQKQAERIERGQKRRLENPHREREEPPAPEAPAAPPEEESSEESLDTGAPPVVLREAPVPPEPAVSQQAERIRAVRLESSESEGKPSGPFSPPSGPPVRPRNKGTEPEPAFAEPQQEEAEPEPTTEATSSGDTDQARAEPTELEEAARAADGAFVVVKEEPDFSEDEAVPQASPPAEVSWVFVRDLLDEAAVDPEAPTSPAQAPEEAPAATAESSTGAGGPAQAGSTADSTLGSTIESLGVSEGSCNGDPAAECADSAADGSGGGPAAC